MISYLSYYKVYLLLLLLLPLTVINAQNVPHKAVKSAVFKDEYKGSTLVYATDDNSGGTLAIRSLEGGLIPFPKGYAFERYDANMVRTQEFIYDNKDAYVLGLVTNNDMIHIIEVSYDKARKAYVWYAATSSVNQFNFTKKELFEVKGKKNIIYNYDINTSSIATSMITSADKSSFAIIFDNKRSEEYHKIYAFTNTLEQKFMYDFTGSFTSYNNENISISPDGNYIYILTKVITEQTKEKEKGGKYEFRLYSIGKDSRRELAFGVNEHYVTSLHATVFSDKVICAGFYSDRKRKGADGICFFEIDPGAMVLTKQKYNPFTEQFITDKFGDDDTDEEELRTFVSKPLMVTYEGNYIFTAEDTWITKNTNLRDHTSYNTYHYDDIVCAKISPEGNVLWARNINKKQSSDWNTMFLSYTPVVHKEDTYLFINTSGKVNKLSEGRIEFDQAILRQWSKIYIIKVDGNGLTDYQEIPEDKDKIPFMVPFGQVTNKSNIYFLGRANGKKQLLKVGFD